MLVCDTASLALLLSVPVAAWTGALTFPHLLGVALLVGTASVFFQVYLPGLVATEDLPEASAKLQGSKAAAQVAGPGLAGLVTQAVGAVAGLLVNALTFAVSALCLLRIRTSERTEATSASTGEPAPGLRRQISAGLRFLAADHYLRVLDTAP